MTAPGSINKIWESPDSWTVDYLFDTKWHVVSNRPVINLTLVILNYYIYIYIYYWPDYIWIIINRYYHPHDHHHHHHPSFQHPPLVFVQLHWWPQALVRTQWLAQHDATSGHRMAVAKSTGDDPPWWMENVSKSQFLIGLHNNNMQSYLARFWNSFGHPKVPPAGMFRKVLQRCSKDNHSPEEGEFVAGTDNN